MFHSHEMAKRRIALTSAAALAASQAVDYLTGVPQPEVARAAWGGYLVPIYGLTWLVVALICLAHLHNGRLVTAMSALVGICCAWGIVWAIGSLGDPTTIRVLKTAVVYAALGVLVGALTGLTPAIVGGDGGDRD